MAAPPPAATDPAVAQIEAAANIVIGGVGDQAQRALAEAHLMAMGRDLTSIPLLQKVLDTSLNANAISAAALSLQRLVTEHWNSFAEGMRLQIRECARCLGGPRRGGGVAARCRLADACLRAMGGEGAAAAQCGRCLPLLPPPPRRSPRPPPPRALSPR